MLALLYFYKGFKEAADAVQNIYDNLLLCEGFLIYYPLAAEGLQVSPTPGNLIACPEMLSQANVSSSTRTLSPKIPTELFPKLSEKVEWGLLKRKLNVSLTLWLARRKQLTLRRWVQERKRETAFTYNFHFSKCSQENWLAHLPFP